MHQIDRMEIAFADYLFNHILWLTQTHAHRMNSIYVQAIYFVTKLMNWLMHACDEFLFCKENQTKSILFTVIQASVNIILHDFGQNELKSN